MCTDCCVGKKEVMLMRCDWGVCTNMCVFQEEGDAAGHHAPGMVVNAEHCQEIYDRLQTPRIKHNA